MMQTWKRTEQLLCFVLTICTAARRPRPASSAWAGAATWPAAGTWWWRWWTRPPPPPASTPSTPASGEPATLVSALPLLTMTLCRHCRELVSELGCVDGARVGVHGAGAGGWLAGQVRMSHSRKLDCHCHSVILYPRQLTADWRWVCAGAGAGQARPAATHQVRHSAGARRGLGAPR